MTETNRCNLNLLVNSFLFYVSELFSSDRAAAAGRIFKENSLFNILKISLLTSTFTFALTFILIKGLVTRL